MQTAWTNKSYFAFIVVLFCISELADGFTLKYPTPMQTAGRIRQVGTRTNQLMRNKNRQVGRERVLFRKGDLLSCSVDGLVNHIYLASSNTTVIHNIGEIGFSQKAQLKEEDFETARKDFKDCKVVTQKYNNIMFRMSPGYSADEAVERARMDLATYANEKIYYDILFCNCEHWVMSWKFGIARSVQAFNLPTNDKCAL